MVQGPLGIWKYPGANMALSVPSKSLTFGTDGQTPPERVGLFMSPFFQRADQTIQDAQRPITRRPGIIGNIIAQKAPAAVDTATHTSPADVQAAQSQQPRILGILGQNGNAGPVRSFIAALRGQK